MDIEFENKVKAIRSMEKGKGFVGPDCVGCINTGTAPTITRSRVFASVYLVGPELKVQDARSLICRGEYGEKQSLYEGRETVWLFKSFAPAKTKFLELCRKRISDNEKIVREHKPGDC